MEKFYTLFIATNELLTCSAIFSFGKKHDHLMQLGTEEILHFKLPGYLACPPYAENICLAFNPEMIEVTKASVSEDSGHLYTTAVLCVTVIARDIGSTKIAITTPRRAAESRLKTFLPHIINRPQLA